MKRLQVRTRDGAAEVFAVAVRNDWGLSLWLHPPVA